MFPVMENGSLLPSNPHSLDPERFIYWRYLCSLRCPGWIQHLVILCVPKSNQLFEQVQLDGIVRELPRDAIDFRSLLFYFFSRLQTHTQATTSIILWSLWKNRNSKLWQAGTHPPHHWSFSERIIPFMNDPVYKEQDNLTKIFQFKIQCRLCPLQQQYHHMARHLLSRLFRGITLWII